MVNPSSKKPVIAKVYLLSGKHYKTIHFTKYEDIDGKNINTEMKFIDHLRKEETTFLNFKTVKQEKNIPDRYFIKTYLPDLSTEVIE